MPRQCGQALWKREAQGCQYTALQGTEACGKIPVHTNLNQSNATRDERAVHTIQVPPADDRAQ